MSSRSMPLSRRLGPERRGEAFPVVAGEVRKLAENSSRAASDINGVVESLGRRMDRLVDSSERSVDLVDSNFAKSAEAKDAFGAISSLISKSGDEIAAIASAMRGIAAAGESLKTNMDAVEGLSSANAGRIAEIGQSVSQLAEQAIDLSSTANSLKTMAESQGLLLSQLTTSESETK